VQQSLDPKATHYLSCKIRLYNSALKKKAKLYNKLNKRTLILKEIYIVGAFFMSHLLRKAGLFFSHSTSAASLDARASSAAAHSPSCLDQSCATHDWKVEKSFVGVRGGCAQLDAAATTAESQEPEYLAPSLCIVECATASVFLFSFKIAKLRTFNRRLTELGFTKD
jgi:hypothetical protein